MCTCVRGACVHVCVCAWHIRACVCARAAAVCAHAHVRTFGHAHVSAYQAVHWGSRVHGGLNYKGVTLPSHPHTHTRTHISQGQSTVTWGTGPNLPTEIGEVTVGLVSGGTKLVVVGGYTCVTEVSSSDAKPTIPPPFQASSVTIPCRAVVWTKIPAEPPLA
jgi:hypothetical protein